MGPCLAESINLVSTILLSLAFNNVPVLVGCKWQKYPGFAYPTLTEIIFKKVTKKVCSYWMGGWNKELFYGWHQVFFFIRRNLSQGGVKNVAFSWV